MSQSHKQHLMDLRAELISIQEIGQAAAETVELDQTRQGRLSRMDALQQQAMFKASNARREKKLRDIEAALKRIENGDFGYCIECEEEINQKRLQHNPAVTLCIECAEALEK